LEIIERLDVTHQLILLLLLVLLVLIIILFYHGTRDPED